MAAGTTLPGSPVTCEPEWLESEAADGTSMARRELPRLLREQLQLQRKWQQLQAEAGHGESLLTGGRRVPTVATANVHARPTGARAPSDCERRS
jgi:hypothetical protein